MAFCEKCGRTPCLCLMKNDEPKYCHHGGGPHDDSCEPGLLAAPSQHAYEATSRGGCAVCGVGPGAAVHNIPVMTDQKKASALDAAEERAQAAMKIPHLAGGSRDGTKEGKTRFSLLSPWAIEGAARVSTYGAKKYTRTPACDCGAATPPRLSTECSSTCASRTPVSGAHNWAKGLSWAETIDSLERHLNAFKKGEHLDDGPGGSGLPHIDHLVWNAMALSHFEKLPELYAKFDDRWKLPTGAQNSLAIDRAGDGPGTSFAPSAKLQAELKAMPVPGGRHYYSGSFPSQLMACGTDGGNWADVWAEVTCEACLVKKPQMSPLIVHMLKGPSAATLTLRYWCGAETRPQLPGFISTPGPAGVTCDACLMAFKAAGQVFAP